MDEKVVTVKDERDMPLDVRDMKEFEDTIDGKPVIWRRYDYDTAGNWLDYPEWVAYEQDTTKV